MTASKHGTGGGSADLAGETDLARVDAHVVQPHEYEDLPELTDEMMERADLHLGGKLLGRGRPRIGAPKKLVSIRFDQDVIDRLRATGPGWQTRVNDVVRAWLDHRR